MSATAAGSGAQAAKEGLRQVYALYRQVLRVHRDVLPGPMRELGDATAREEFRRHLRGKTSQPQWREFGAQWGSYVSMLRGRGDLEDRSGEIPEHVVEVMTPEQQEQLALLKEAVQDLGRSMITGAPQPPGEDPQRGRRG